MVDPRAHHAAARAADCRDAVVPGGVTQLGRSLPAPPAAAVVAAAVAASIAAAVASAVAATNLSALCHPVAKSTPDKLRATASGACTAAPPAPAAAARSPSWHTTTVRPRHGRGGGRGGGHEVGCRSGVHSTFKALGEGLRLRQSSRLEGAAALSSRLPPLQVAPPPRRAHRRIAKHQQQRGARAERRCEADRRVWRVDVGSGAVDASAERRVEPPARRDQL